MDKFTSHEPTQPDDRLYRDICVLVALTDAFRPVPLRLRVDARREKRGRFLLCEILNIRRTGPGVELSRSVDPSDGFLDVVSAEAGERSKLQALLEGCLAGKVAAPLLRTQRARRVRLALGAQ
jgi:diacylglycerol kinase family enzyme